MLRSLVGSEMCIRDRRWIVCKANKFDIYILLIYVKLYLFERTFNKKWSCLLYTSDAADEEDSDAADEEDSVDLGGRRIIKKKNTKSRR